MLILAALIAAGIALIPHRSSSPDVGKFQAEPDDSDDDEEWVLPPPRREIAI